MVLNNRLKARTRKMAKTKAEEQEPQVSQVKPAPAFICDDYPNKAEGEALKPEDCENGVVYEIKCHQCGISIRSQGQNIRATWERLKTSGCISCGGKGLDIKCVDMRKDTQQQI